MTIRRRAARWLVSIAQKLDHKPQIICQSDRFIITTDRMITEDERRNFTKELAEFLEACLNT